MEGINFVGILLACLGVIVAVGGCLVALGLAVARQSNAARIVCAAGLFCAAAIGAYAAFTYLDDISDRKATIVLPVMCLLLAGCGQFVAALYNPRMYRAALSCGAGTVAFLMVPDLKLDVARTYVPGAQFIHHVLSTETQSLPGVTLALAVALLLAGLSLIVALLPSRRRNTDLLPMRPGDECPSTEQIKPA